MFSFKIIHKDKKTKARTGILTTPHGKVKTPCFVPVATKAALKGVDFDTISNYGADIFMMNTFHLFLNNKFKIINQFHGLHNFANLKKPIMTDSGGFQVFSLGFGSEHGVGKISNIFPEQEQINNTNNNSNNKKVKEKNKSNKKQKENLVKINDNYVTFKSPYNGQLLKLNPEISIEIQKQLGADIIFSFDECTSPLSDYEYTKKALNRTHAWALRSLEHYNKICDLNKQAIFGIIQGGNYKDLRLESAKFINNLDFFGYGIGGSLGKTKKDMHKILEWTIKGLDENKPRHLLGIGDVDDIFECVERGIDMFDCVSPTRLARHGAAITSKGRLNLKSSRYNNNKEPLDKTCKCNVCKTHSKAYISYLVKENELYAIQLLAEHNLAFILNLMKEIRQSLIKNTFKEFKEEFLRNYKI